MTRQRALAEWTLTTDVVAIVRVFLVAEFGNFLYLTPDLYMFGGSEDAPRPIPGTGQEELTTKGRGYYSLEITLFPDESTEASWTLTISQ